MTHDAAGEDRPDLTDKQAALPAEEFSRRSAKVSEIVGLLTRHVEVGVRDRDTFDRVLSGLSHEGLGIMQFCVAPWFPDMPQRAAEALAEAAGVAPAQGGMREAVQQQAALGLLTAVWTAEHHLVRREDWPDELAAVVPARSAGAADQRGSLDGQPPRTRSVLTGGRRDSPACAGEGGLHRVGCGH